MSAQPKQEPVLANWKQKDSEQNDTVVTIVFVIMSIQIGHLSSSFRARHGNTTGSGVSTMGAKALRCCRQWAEDVSRLVLGR